MSKALRHSDFIMSRVHSFPIAVSEYSYAVTDILKEMERG